VKKISKYKTATAYAQAWLDASKDKKLEDLVFNEVLSLRSAVKENINLWTILSVPADDNSEKLKIVSDLSNKVKLSDISSESLKLVTENNRLDLIELILDEFVHLYYKNKGIVEVDVETAIKLSTKQDKNLIKILEKKLNSPVVINYHINSDVLGGLKISYNSFMFDDTLISKLNRIEKLLKQES
jgi:F-type H+-transporting ATPase subunit delta